MNSVNRVPVGTAASIEGILAFALLAFTACEDSRVDALQARLQRADEQTAELRQGVAAILTRVSEPTPTPFPTVNPQPTPTPQPTPASTPTPKVVPTSTLTLPLAPTGLHDWGITFAKLVRSRQESVRRSDYLIEKERQLGYNIPTEWRAHLEWMRGPDGPYGRGRLNLPRFTEVRGLNDRIIRWAENYFEEAQTYVRSLETADRSLYVRSEALRRANNDEWNAIVDAVQDLLATYGLRLGAFLLMVPTITPTGPAGS